MDNAFYLSGIQDLTGGTASPAVLHAYTFPSRRTLAVWVEVVDSAPVPTAAVYDPTGRMLGAPVALLTGDLGTTATISDLVVLPTLPATEGNTGPDIVAPEAVEEGVVFWAQTDDGVGTIRAATATLGASAVSTTSAHPTGSIILSSASSDLAVDPGFLDAVLMTDGYFALGYPSLMTDDTPTVTIALLDPPTASIPFYPTSPAYQATSASYTGMALAPILTTEGLPAVVAAFMEVISTASHSAVHAIILDGQTMAALAAPSSAFTPFTTHPQVFAPFPDESTCAGLGAAAYTFTNGATSPTASSFALATVAAGQEVLLRAFHLPAPGQAWGCVDAITVYGAPDGSSETLGGEVSLSAAELLGVTFTVTGRTAANQAEVVSVGVSYVGTETVDGGRVTPITATAAGATFASLFATQHALLPVVPASAMRTMMIGWVQTPAGSSTQTAYGRVLTAQDFGLPKTPQRDSWPAGETCFGASTLWVMSNETDHHVYAAMFSPAITNNSGGIVRAAYFDPHQGAGVETSNDRDYLILASTTSHPAVRATDFQVAVTGEGVFTIDPIALVSNSGSAQVTSAVFYWDEDECAEVQAGKPGPVRGGNTGVHTTPGEPVKPGEGSRFIVVEPEKPIAQPSPLWIKLLVAALAVAAAAACVAAAVFARRWFTSPARAWEVARGHKASEAAEYRRVLALEGALNPQK